MNQRGSKFDNGTAIRDTQGDTPNNQSTAPTIIYNYWHGPVNFSRNNVRQVENALFGDNQGYLSQHAPEGRKEQKPVDDARALKYPIANMAPHDSNECRAISWKGDQAVTRGRAEPPMPTIKLYFDPMVLPQAPCPYSVLPSKDISSDRYDGAFKESLDLTPTLKWNIGNVKIKFRDLPGAREGFSATIPVSHTFPPFLDVATSVRVPDSGWSKAVESRDNAVCASTASTAYSLSKGGTTSWDAFTATIEANPQVSIIFFDEPGPRDRVLAELQSQDDLSIRGGGKLESAERLAFKLYHWFIGGLMAGGEVIQGDTGDLRSICARTVAGLVALSVDLHGTSSNGQPSKWTHDVVSAHMSGPNPLEGLTIRYATVESGILRYSNRDSPILMAYRFEIAATLRSKRSRENGRWKSTLDIGAVVNRKYYEVVDPGKTKLSTLGSAQTHGAALCNERMGREQH
ncbi:hypothetical protein DFP72DRAFT_1171974 [Ephemerocybe angulata]|uniref:Uncharacterized protein n=1 Tax=Ephemerocybe angulata TaxID=980116 RepID=A0A8H6M572_9AGAR|nr:hypothetical protein DFP72DRAFT_1171974 [Tulosesus angulatus]